MLGLMAVREMDSRLEQEINVNTLCCFIFRSIKEMLAGFPEQTEKLTNVSLNVE